MSRLRLALFRTEYPQISHFITELVAGVLSQPKGVAVNPAERCPRLFRAFVVDYAQPGEQRTAAFHRIRGHSSAPRIWFRTFLELPA